MRASVNVILHVGLHKTASSSIQRTLGNEREVLRAHGFEYALFNNFRGDDHVNHSLPMFVAFSSRYREYQFIITHHLDPDKERQRFLVQLEDQIKNASKTGRTLIISGEEMSSMSIEDLINLRDWLARFDARMRTICFIRSPYAMTCSDGQEWIKTGRQYRVTHRQSMPAFSRLKSVFPALEISSFQTISAHADGPVGYFLELIGMPGTAIVTPARSNESLSDNIARLIAHINEVEPVSLRGTDSPYRAVHDTRPLWRVGTEKYRLLTHEFAAVEASIRAENNAMRHALGEDYIDIDFPTREQPVAWTNDLMPPLLKALEKLQPELAVLAYSYFHAYELAPRPWPRRMRQLLMTPAHEQARQNLTPAILRMVRNRRQTMPDVAARLRRLVDKPFIDDNPAGSE